MLFKEYESVEAWARDVQGPSAVSLRDVEAAILHFSPDAALAGGWREVKIVGIAVAGGWFGTALLGLILVLPLIGPGMYLDVGTFNTISRSGNIVYDPERAGLLVPIIYACLGLVLSWGCVNWIRAGRVRQPFDTYVSTYLGGSAIVALLLARNVGVDVLLGTNAESTAMWICTAIAMIAFLAFQFGSRTSGSPRAVRGRQNFGFELRAVRRDVATILTARGLLNEPDLEAALAKPFGFHLQQDERAGM